MPSIKAIIQHSINIPKWHFR